MNTKSTAVATQKKDLTSQVLEKIEAFKQSGELRIPKDYSPENALKSAYLVLAETKNRDGKSALEHCTKESVADALLKMVVWGLSPLKKQCDFIMYANKLECSIEYTGNIVLAKRYGNLKEIKAHAIFKGDEFDFEIDSETGRTKIIQHKSSLSNLGNKEVVGAYAVMEMNDGTKDVEIMSIEMIRSAWNQGAMKGNSPAHKNFPDQMAKKTVINRACKLLIRGSDDSVLFQDDDEIKTIDVVAEELKHEEVTYANKELLAIEEAPKQTLKKEVQASPVQHQTNDDEENQRLFEEALANESAQPQIKF